MLFSLYLRVFVAKILLFSFSFCGLLTILSGLKLQFLTNSPPILRGIKFTKAGYFFGRINRSYKNKSNTALKARELKKIQIVCGL